ncbi:class I SAM-dependent methyltransferase [Algoriphagus chordae]|uniref:class I SAM-dependent methyltransferase n=1 Tax=Algoriphagus chordae TaxID=237019 RepID=UPI001FE755B6|nr:methyltransferase domain-containing protein [Algoriphagus chordae]
MIKDDDFDALYPIKMKKLSGTHWTPVDVAKKGMAFLNEKGQCSVLDVGSGAGKFCLIAAAISDSTVTGVEQRESLVQLSRKLAGKCKLQNLNFIHGDFVKLDFRDYDSFYFFNSLEENINLTDKLNKDSSVNLGSIIPILSRSVQSLKDCLQVPESLPTVAMPQRFLKITY